MKTVFILGAGFSKWITPEMPLLRDLAEGLPDDLIDDIRQQQLEPFLENDRFEELLTYLSVAYPWKYHDERLSQTALFERISTYIAEHIRTIELSAHIQLDRPEILKLAKYWSTNIQEILTFNYDTIIEKMIDNVAGNRKWHEYWGLPISNVIQRANIDTTGYYSGDYDSSKRFIVLTKLHGSWNWYRSRYNPQPNEPIYYEPKGNLGDDSLTNLQGLKPFIVPPAIDKSAYLQHDILSVIWARARTHLSQADRIIIIGYSFPASDTYVSLLFRATMNSEKSIVIVNRDSSTDFRNRFEKYFRQFRIKPDFQFTGTEDAINKYIASL